MKRKGFALLEILIVVAVIALLTGGGWYVAHLKSEQSMVQTGVSAEQQAQQVVQQANQQTEEEQDSLSQITSTTPPSSAPVTPLPSCTFSNIPPSIVIPQSINLIWTCKNVDTCSIASNHGDTFPNQNSSGTLMVKPETLPIAYTLSCNGIDGDTSSSTITINPPSQYDGDPGQP